MTDQKAGRGFLAYLSGIETFQLLQRGGTETEFLAYLSGIETQLLLGIMGTQNTVFSVPIRN